MVDILFARTFFIVGAMLLLTAITAKKNRYFETAIEMWARSLPPLCCSLLYCPLRINTP
jgi:hypothetical protein